MDTILTSNLRRETDSMEIDARLELLETIYRIYDNFIADVAWVCGPGCAACCTRNVTATTLEAALMVRRLAGGGDRAWIGRIHAAAAEPRFQPLMTTNELADLCARDAEIPQEELPADTLPCPLLQDDLCAVYDARPFGCRAMVSSVDCAQSAEALMPPLVLSVNNVFLQFIEAVDAGRLFGNLIDMLQLMANPLEYQSYARGLPMHASQQMRVNRSMSVLMIPPRHRQRIGPILDALKTAAQNLR